VQAKRGGFSIVEVLIVVAILGITLAIAPRFRYGSMELTRITDDTAQLLQRARFEAIKRNVSTFIKIDTSNGVIQVYTDDDADGQLDTDGSDHLLQEITASAYRTPISLNSTYTGNIIRWSPWGLPQTQNGALGSGRITLSANSQSKSICISSAGRIRIQNRESCS